MIANGGSNTQFLSNCGPYFLVGGYGIFGALTVFSKIHTALLLHFRARLRFYFLKIDSWINNFLIVKADSHLIYNVSFNEAEDSIITKYCGGAFPEANRMIDIVFNHNSSILNVEITTDLSSGGSWGIYNISLFIHECYNSCSTCSGPTINDCMTCNSGKYLKSFPGPSSCLNLCNDGYFGNTATNCCEICNSACRNCFGPSAHNCLSCPIYQYLLQVDNLFSCFNVCPDQYWIDKKTYTCKPCDLTCGT